MFELVSESFKSAINKLRFVDDEKALKNALDTLKKALLKADVHHKAHTAPKIETKLQI